MYELGSITFGNWGQSAFLYERKFKALKQSNICQICWYWGPSLSNTHAAFACHQYARKCKPRQSLHHAFSSILWLHFLLRMQALQSSSKGYMYGNNLGVLWDASKGIPCRSRSGCSRCWCPCDPLLMMLSPKDNCKVGCCHAPFKSNHTKINSIYSSVYTNLLHFCGSLANLPGKHCIQHLLRPTTFNHLLQNTPF